GMQEADSDGFHILIGEAVERREDLLIIKRFQHFAGSQHPLVDFKREAAADQRAGALEREVERLYAVRAADSVDVPEAFGRQQCGSRTLLFQDGIDGDRGAVKNLVELPGIAIRKVEALADALC